MQPNIVDRVILTYPAPDARTPPAEYAPWFREERRDKKAPPVFKEIPPVFSSDASFEAFVIAYGQRVTQAIVDRFAEDAGLIHVSLKELQAYLAVRGVVAATDPLITTQRHSVGGPQVFVERKCVAIRRTLSDPVFSVTWGSPEYADNCRFLLAAPT